MLTRRGGVLLGVLAAWGAASTAWGADAPELKWKFKAGESLHYRMDQTTVTQAKFNNQDIKTTVKQIVDSTWTVKSVDASGVAEMTQTIDRMRSKIESPFAAVDYDSKSGKTPEGPIAAGLVPMFKALVGSTFQYKMAPTGELSDVKVPEGLVKQLKEAGPTAASVGMLSEEGLKNMIYESSLVLPSKDLDRPWTRQSKIPQPPVGTLVLDKTYKYDGTSKDGERIVLNVKVSLEPDKASNVSIKIEDQKGEGTFYFDAKAGRVSKSTVGEKVDMVITVMGNEVKQSTDTTSTMTLVDGKDE